MNDLGVPPLGNLQKIDVRMRRCKPTLQASRRHHGLVIFVHTIVSVPINSVGMYVLCNYIIYYIIYIGMVIIHVKL